MKTKAFFGTGTLICLVAFASSGCVGIDGGLGEIVGPAILDSGFQIMDDPIELSNPNGQFVFVQIDDETGSGLGDVSRQLTELLMSQGYVIVASQQEADYIITGQVTKFARGLADSPEVAALWGTVGNRRAVRDGVIAAVVVTGFVMAFTPRMYVAEMDITFQERTLLSEQRRGRGKVGYMNSQCVYHGYVKAAPFADPREAMDRLGQTLAESVASLFSRNN